MAWSSTSESGDLSPTSPYLSGSPLLGDGCGAGSGTFAEFLVQRRRYGGSLDPHVPAVLLTPAACGHCRKLEDLRRGRNTSRNSDSNSDGSAPVPDLDGSVADQISLEGNSCFTCVKMIFEATQWIDDVDGHNTPLHYAARSGNLRMLFHLICQLGDFYGHEWTVLVLRKLNLHGETALHEAIRLGTSKCMVGMLMWVDPGLAQHPGSGTSPLYLAVSLGHKHIAEILHSTNGGNLSYSGPDGQNALHAAVHRPYGMIEMVLDWNTDLSKDKDKNGSTPLHTLVSAQYEDKIRIYCLDFTNMWHGLDKYATGRILDANPYAAYEKDKNGLLPVHIAVLMDRMVAILILLKRCRGCIALRDKQGRSFLHIAVRNKVHRMVKFAGQEPIFAPIVNARDNDGNTSLHLAVEVEDLVIFCHLMRNPKVLLNVRNKKDQTPLDLARSKTLTDFSYAMNPENVIYKTLRDAGARHGRFWGDRVQQLCIQNELSTLKDEENRSEEGNDLEKHDKTEDIKKKEDEKKEANRKKKEIEEKKDSDQLTDSTRTLGIGSVLITTMTFGATLALPSAVKATNNSSGGISGHLGAWYFDAFMMANTLTFICSSVATLCLMFSGMSMVKLQIRRMYFQVSVFLTSSSLTSLIVAFALGLHMVLASVGRPVSDVILILLIIPFLLAYQTTDLAREMRLTYQPLSVRQGHKFVCWLFLGRFLLWVLRQFWPYIFILSWAESRIPAA